MKDMSNNMDAVMDSWACDYLPSYRDEIMDERCDLNRCNGDCDNCSQSYKLKNRNGSSNRDT